MFKVPDNEQLPAAVTLEVIPRFFNNCRCAVEVQFLLQCQASVTRDMGAKASGCVNSAILLSTCLVEVNA